MVERPGEGVFMKCAYRTVVLLGILGMFAIACGEGGVNQGPLILEDDEEAVPDSTILVKPGALTLAVHESQILRAQMQEHDGAPLDVAFQWTSENEAVAVVDRDDQVTGVGAGITTIVVKTGQQKASVEVTVRALQYRSVAVGDEHSCAVTWSGEVYCWGDNSHLRLGRADVRMIASPVKIALPEPMMSVTVAPYHGCALARSGQAYCWGNNQFFQLGVGKLADDVSLPVAVQGPRFKALSASDYHTCGLSTDDDVYCWGYNEFGALGKQQASDSPTPQKVMLDSKIQQVVTSEYNTCLLDVTGNVHCMGSNHARILHPYGGETSLLPVKVGGEHTFTHLTIGRDTVCGVTTEATIMCWGEASPQVLGRVGADSFLPRAIHSTERFEKVFGGPYASCALKSDGQLHCWGFNFYGGLGDGTNQERFPGPVTGTQRWSSVSIGYVHSCGIALDGVLWCWGKNQFGQVGDGRTLGSAEPVRAAGETLALQNLTGANGGTCGQDKNTQKFYCWGNNEHFELGIPEEGRFATQPALLQYPEYFWQQLSMGTTHSCALDYIGQAYCWGSNKYWQLGNDYLGVVNFPFLKVAGNLQFASIYAGVYHSCALTRNGQAYCWGSNTQGQLGSAISVGEHRPKAVETSLRFVQMALGEGHTCGLTKEGAVYCWGANLEGVLGSQSAPTNSTTPIAVTLDAPIVTLKSAARHTCGMAEDKMLRCWGSNELGNLGDGSFAQAPGPVKVNGQWTDFDMDSWTTCARNLEGDFYCWGWNGAFQISPDKEARIATPRRIDPGFPVREYAVGGTSTCVLDEGGHPYCWGLNTLGELGDAPNSYVFAPWRVTSAAPLP